MIAVTGYQVMPALSDEEYAALKADIADRGVLVAIVKDQHGNVLDGHHRERICRELDIKDYPIEVRKVTDADEARDIAFTLNLARRHLTREQKRALIVAEIQARPADSDRAIGRRLGVDHKTVGAARRELSGEIPQPSLTPAQRQEAALLFELMKARTLRACDLIRRGEPVSAWTVYKATDGDAHGEAWRRFTEWACTSDEARGVLWDYADDEPAGWSR